MNDVDLGTLECPHCSVTGPRVRYRIDDHLIVRCRSCALMWLHPRLTPEEIREVYKEHYYSNEAFLSGDNHYLYGYSDYIGERINKPYSYKLMVRKARELLSSRPAGRQMAGRGLEVLRAESIGHTFQLSFLIERIGLMLPLVGSVLRAVVFPRWLLDANLYVNPGTKMPVFARPRSHG